MWLNPQKTAYFVTYTEEILNGNVIFCAIFTEEILNGNVIFCAIFSRIKFYRQMPPSFTHFFEILIFQ